MQRLICEPSLLDSHQALYRQICRPVATGRRQKASQMYYFVNITKSLQLSVSVPSLDKKYPSEVKYLLKDFLQVSGLHILQGPKINSAKMRIFDLYIYHQQYLLRGIASRYSRPFSPKVPPTLICSERRSRPRLSSTRISL
jgi:hypothetical protein